MKNIIVYHGSEKIIEKPIFGFGKTYNDYGLGFYCTEHIELAKEWACTENIDGYANKYSLDLDGLKIFNLSDNGYNILNWLAILMQNRIVKLSTPIQERARGFLINNFLPDSQDCDVIIGYRADDAYFNFARAFIRNEISLKQLSYAMRLGKLGEQYCLKSEKAFNKLKFEGYEIADNGIYYLKKKERNDSANNDFIKQLEQEDLNGIYIRDIMKEDLRNGDKRLQF